MRQHAFAAFADADAAMITLMRCRRLTPIAATFHAAMPLMSPPDDARRRHFHADAATLIF